MSRHRTHPAKAVLVARRISQRTAARAIGCNPTYLCQVLNGEAPPSEDFKSRLSDFLNEPSSALFADLTRCVCGRTVLA